MKIDVIVTSNNSQDFDNQLLESQLDQHEFNVSPLCYQVKSTDSDKVDNLISAITGDSDVILAMRGGSGATRLMAELNQLPKLVKPKCFVGYSDLTVLLNYLNRDSNYTCIHGPMAFELTTNERIDRFEQALAKTDVKFAKPASWLTSGKIKGKVVGGNLMLVTDSIGTFYQPEFNNRILLIEEIDEPIDKLDRMFAQLRDSQILSQVKAIILGNFKDCASDEELQQLFKLYLQPLDIPILYNVNLGHVDDSDYIHLNTELEIDENGIYYNKETDESN